MECGSVAKSNFTTRARDPIYPYLALGLSYFDGYFNPYGKHTMRSFTVPVELEPFEERGWRFSEKPLHYIDRSRREGLGTAASKSRRAEQGEPAPSQAGLLGSKPEGCCGEIHEIEELGEIIAKG